MDRDLLPGGVWPVMLTPFTDDGAVDLPALDELVEWYLDAGVAGLFPVSLSSEMYELTPAERRDVAARTVEAADGRAPAIATGAFGETIEERADTVASMAETGVDAVVVTPAQLVGPDATDEALRERLFTLLDATDAPLGLYECPQPYHRTVPPALVADLAETGRFRFLKETSRHPETVARKVEAAAGTPLRVFNAHGQTLLATLDAGAAGYAGIAANYYPGLLAWLCDHHDSPEAADLDGFLTVADHAIRNRYPAAAKRYLGREGLSLTPTTRVESDPFEPGDRHTLDTLARRTAAWREKLGVSTSR
jgi:4-hydroxy-tetrahydrodipicolinate synthase